MLHCLCGPPSIPLSFNLAAVLPRRDTECVSSGTAGWTPATPRIHRLRRGLPGYLIPFAPHAVAPQRQGQASAPPSPPVFFRISTHFTAPPGIPCTSPALQPRRLAAVRRLSRRFPTATYAAAYTPFTPSHSGQRSPPTSYRGCWHVVCRGLLGGYRPPAPPGAVLVPPDRVLQPEGRLHSRGVAPSGLRPLWKIPYCCLP
jgi:hypothetical protein